MLLLQDRPGNTSVPFFAIVWLLLLPYVCNAYADTPSDAVKRTIEQAKGIFNDVGLSKKEQITALQKIADERFDFAEAARRSLSFHWKDLTPEQRKEFISLFSTLIKKTYSAKIMRYEKEIRAHTNDRVRYLDERIDMPYARVVTRVFTYNERNISIDYHLINKGKRWFLYDVVVEGISFINNYRSQFNEILATRSYEDLVRRLKEKIRQ